MPLIFPALRQFFGEREDRGQGELGKGAAVNTFRPRDLDRPALHFCSQIRIGAAARNVKPAELFHAREKVFRHWIVGEDAVHAHRVAEERVGQHAVVVVVVEPDPAALDRDRLRAELLDEARFYLSQSMLEEARRRFPELIELYDNTASLQDRTVTTGILKPELAHQFGAGGYVGRASGRAFDARRVFGYAPYDRLSFEVPVLDAGDVNARVWIRIREVEQSLSLVDQILAALPKGALKAPTGKSKACEGLGIAEAFRGDVLVWLKLDSKGRVARCHLRDASWFQWPLLETAIDGNIVADFPLCNKSFNCSYSGHDL